MQENIVLRPRSGNFDVERTRRFVLGQPSCFEDPRGTGMLFVVVGAGAREYAIDQRIESETNSICGGIVDITAEHIVLTIWRAGRDGLEVMRDLAQWMLDTYQPTISSEIAGDDWTERCAGNIDIMFEPALPRRAPV